MSTNNIRSANGHRRRQAVAWVKATQDTCALCHQPIDWSIKSYKDKMTGKRIYPPMMGEVDEIIPVSKGGSPIERDNIQAAHRICNQRKGNRLFYVAKKNPKKEIKHSQEW